MGNPDKRRLRARKAKKSANRKNQGRSTRRPKSPTRFTIDYGNPDTLVTAGPLVNGTWSIPKALQTQLTKEQKPIPAPVHGRMLIDTGATSTCIALGVAQNELGLKPTSTRKTRGSGGLKDNPVFYVRFRFSITSQSTGESTVIERDMQATGIPRLDDPMETVLDEKGNKIRIIGLIGRDFLRHTKLNYDGARGKFELVVDMSTVPKGAV